MLKTQTGSATVAEERSRRGASDIQAEPADLRSAIEERAQGRPAAREARQGAGPYGQLPHGDSSPYGPRREKVQPARHIGCCAPLPLLRGA